MEWDAMQCNTMQLCTIDLYDRPKIEKKANENERNAWIFFFVSMFGWQSKRSWLMSVYDSKEKYTIVKCQKV